MEVVRFSVVAWGPKDAGMYVVGNHQDLGSWDPDKGCQMACTLGDSKFDSEPDYWWVDVPLPASDFHSIEFKFVQKLATKEWKWEGAGGGDNRRLVIDDGSEVGNMLLLPVEKFIEGSTSESDHTGRFWRTIKENKEFCLRQVSRQIILGNCPQHKAHINTLKEMGVTVVMNFQTEADCAKNCVQDTGMEMNVLAVKDLYDDVGIQYIWLPTWDMSTSGRVTMLPHASFTLAGLIKRQHVVFVHCNAGVGRSVAAVCGFLAFSVGLSFRQLQHVVARARTVAFFDFQALEQAKPQYEALFGHPDADLQSQKALLLQKALIPNPDLAK